MKRLFAVLLVTLLSSLGVTTLSYTAGLTLVEGDLLKIEGEWYTVHGTAGHEVRVHVDKTTQLEGGAFKAGDKIEAYMTENGHARSLYHLAHMDPAK